ncbi:equilibrative nucleoside transporter 4 isoform X1 [Eupeodes corollae]|uniref:equilibrative nucleoside transporter 4 isoform X1 n=1 Tax=Eupeodes corollae TaxID=290404 RepID=UPI0024911B3E|nr:equilibrative nucleoside transporter 4 isoform X1 [Eupeodes corollae]XP_055907451.1 equilibrative nucleoside transporter 4 isoform X1 [Eupeodes corollae]XP_055907452.1 equilibrative nucleoside transporter 4 isoform X1 [Eupeodes corollae]
MESAQATTYEPLEGRRVNHHEPMDSPEIDVGPPKDRKHVVYLALLAAGIGFVLPYNSFIIAADYWQARFPGRSVALDMSMTYIIVAFATVLLNNVFLSLAPFRIRVLFGYVISFTTLIFVAVCEVAWHMFAANTAYSVNLAAVSLVAIGCTVQQSSFYGFASMLPKQYTQAVMAGESLAGFFVSSNRIVTKLLIQNDRVSTVVFFLASTMYIAFSYVMHVMTIHSPFVRYHMKACAKIVLRPDEDRLFYSFQNDALDGDTATAKYGVLTLESSPPSMQATGNAPTALSFSNPVYELSNPTAGESVIEGLNNLPEVPTTPQEAPNVAYKVEHILTPGQCNPGKLTDLRNGFDSRWRVAQAIYPYMVCIAMAYCVTLSLYPGIESEIVSCSLGTWLPVLLMFTFNTADVIGKILAAVPYTWSRRQLILMSGLRIVLVPMLLLCCAPRAHPVITGETAAFIFTFGLGVSNGLAGSLPMMLAPAKVPGTLKEVTGNMMTLSYNVGLTAGSLIGYVFESMLGAQLTNPCPTYPYIPSHMIIDNSNLHHITTPNSSILMTTLAPTTPATLLTSTAAATTVATTARTLLTTMSSSLATLPTTMATLFTTMTSDSAQTGEEAVTKLIQAALTTTPESTTDHF